MSALLPIDNTDNFDIERQKINSIVDAVNNLASNGTQIIFSLTNPVNNQDILVYDAAFQVFQNTGLAAIISQFIGSSGQNAANSRTLFFANLNRTIY